MLTFYPTSLDTSLELLLTALGETLGTVECSPQRGPIGPGIDSNPKAPDVGVADRSAGTESS